MYLRANGFPRAARTLAGAREDRGDIAHVPLALQVKNCKEFRWSEWLKEAEQQAEFAGLTRYAVIAKPPRVVDPADWYCLIPMWLLTEFLLEDA